jgi:hypothetical protein
LPESQVLEDESSILGDLEDKVLLEVLLQVRWKGILFVMVVLYLEIV